MFADSINLMARTHYQRCFDTAHAGAEGSLHQALLQGGCHTREPALAAPSGRLPGGLFFPFYFYEDILRPRFVLYCCSTPLFPNLK